MRSILGDEQRALGDRILIGHCLHLLYWSWWSDAFQASNLFIDGEGRFFQFTTRAHKSARSAELKSRLLPVVAPCQGITEDRWALTYI
jgi:hypothetical protein